jgi:ABC-2 type transport system permease protein
MRDRLGAITLTVDEYDSARRQLPALEELYQIVRYRDLVVQLVARNVKTRYKRSVFGVAWTMLNPLLMMVVMTVVFSRLLRIPIPHFPVFLLSGLLVWTFFAQTTTHAVTELLWGGALLNRIYVPRTVFVASAVGTGLVNLVLGLVPLVLVMLATGLWPTAAMIFLPVPILLVAAFAAGVGLLLSALAVRFADVVDMYQVVLMAWMYLTPVFYSLDVVPAQYHWLIRLNPAYYLVEAFRVPVFAGRLPDAAVLGYAVTAAALTLLIGWWTFTVRAEEVVYRV